MDPEIDQQRLANMRKLIMKLERTNAYTNEYSNSEMQKKIQIIIEEEAFNDH